MRLGVTGAAVCDVATAQTVTLLQLSWCLRTNIASGLPLFDSSPNVLLPRTDVSTESNTSLWLTWFARPLLRWDAFYFVHIAQEGYVYEQEWAFFPGASIVMKAMTSIGRFAGFLGPSAKHDLAHLLMGGAIASLNCRTANILYDLTLHHFKSPSMAFLTCLLSLLPSSPATLLYTVYNEPFFTYFSYRGMLYCAKSRWLLATTCFVFAASFRSNGIMLCIYILWGLFGEPLLQRSLHVTQLCKAALSSLAIFSPFIYHQYTAYAAFCSYTSEDKPTWCTAFPPAIYSYVQGHYWNVGFMRYWTLSQLPNILMAVPPLLSIVTYAVLNIRSHLIPHLLALPQNRRLIQTTASSKKDNQSFTNLSLTPHAVHALALSLILLFSAHTQIALRFVASLPFTYWAAAYLMICRPRAGKCRRLVAPTLRLLDTLIVPAPTLKRIIHGNTLEQVYTYIANLPSSMDSPESLMSSSATHQEENAEINNGSSVVGSKYISEPRTPNISFGTKEGDSLAHLSRMLDEFGNVVSEDTGASVPSIGSVHKPRLLGERFAPIVHASEGALSTGQNHTAPPDSAAHGPEHQASLRSLVDDYGTRFEAVEDETTSEAEQEDVEQSLDFSGDPHNTAAEEPSSLTDAETPEDISKMVVDVDRKDPTAETCDNSTELQDASFTTEHASSDEDCVSVVAAFGFNTLGQGPHAISADLALIPGSCATSTIATYTLPREGSVSLDNSEEVCDSEANSGHELLVTTIPPSCGDGGHMSPKDSETVHDEICQTDRDPPPSALNSSPLVQENVPVAEEMAEIKVTVPQPVTSSPPVSQPDRADNEDSGDILESQLINNGEMPLLETMEENSETSATVSVPTPSRKTGEDIASSLPASTQDSYVAPGDSFALGDLSTSGATSCNAISSAPADIDLSALAGDEPTREPAGAPAALIDNPLEAGSLPGSTPALALDTHSSTAEPGTTLELVSMCAPETVATIDDIEMQDIAGPSYTIDKESFSPSGFISAKTTGSNPEEIEETVFGEDMPIAETVPPAELFEPVNEGPGSGLCTDSTLAFADPGIDNILLDLDKPAVSAALEPNLMATTQSQMESKDVSHTSLEDVDVPEISSMMDPEPDTERSVVPTKEAAPDDIALPLVVVSSPDGESTIHDFGQGSPLSLNKPKASSEQDGPQDVNPKTFCETPTIEPGEFVTGIVGRQAEIEAHDLTPASETNAAELEDLPPSSLPSSQASDTEPPEVPDKVDVISDVENLSGGCSAEKVEGEGVPEGQLPQAAAIADEPFEEEPLLLSLPPSSQPRDSSPDRIFSSPPPGLVDSPPSSPLLTALTNDKDSKDADVDVQMLDVDGAPGIDEESELTLGKRPRSPSPTAFALEMDEEEQDRGSKRPVSTLYVAVGPFLKRRQQRERSPTPPPPQPLRYTAAGLKAQFKKLAKPFRCPLMKPEDSLVGREAIYGSTHATLYPPKTAAGTKAGPPEDDRSSSLPAKINVDAVVIQQVKPFSERLTKQFKSPLAGAGSSSASGKALFSSTKSTQAAQIQALQAKVQKLKQAIKIKNERSQADEENLAALVSKWRGVGRDVAWLVWDTVKDLDPGEGLSVSMGRGGWGDEDGMSKGKMRNSGFDGGWGYDDGKKRDEYGGLNKNWGWDDPSGREGSETADGDGAMEVDVAEEQPSQPHSLGTMLRHLGIDPETLGWNEDEGDFIGVA
ncbi:hypothetical protein EIP86_003907 [Pleurotus ostreatoroseus]|nr:hypothetical protein EIP86_003907 [Pleurotus ostreatoroseus]